MADLDTLELNALICERLRVLITRDDPVAMQEAAKHLTSLAEREEALAMASPNERDFYLELADADYAAATLFLLEAERAHRKLAATDAPATRSRSLVTVAQGAEQEELAEAIREADARWSSRLERLKLAHDQISGSEPEGETK